MSNHTVNTPVNTGIFLFACPLNSSTPNAGFKLGCGRSVCLVTSFKRQPTMTLQLHDDQIDELG